jgi:hypothetical protein
LTANLLGNNKQTEFVRI